MATLAWMVASGPWISRTRTKFASAARGRPLPRAVLPASSSARRLGGWGRDDRAFRSATEVRIVARLVRPPGAGDTWEGGHRRAGNHHLATRRTRSMVGK